MARILITKHRASGASGTSEALQREIARSGRDIAFEAGSGFVVEADESDLSRLDDEGFRWTELRDADVLRIGGFTIDVTAPEQDVPPELRVPEDEERHWTHRLVQLVAPPTPEWIADLQRLGVQVVEPLGPYGLFVLADARQAKLLAQRRYVAWSGLFEPAYRMHPALGRADGRVEFVGVDVVPAEDVDRVRAELEALGADIRNVETPPPTNPMTAARILCDVDAEQLPAIARIPSVRWIEPQGPDILLDERSAQIVAENLTDVAAPNNAPVTGYQAAIAALGLSGAGVCIGICDSGVDNHDNATMHGDLAGRLLFFVDASAGNETVDEDGHGTHVAAIAAGNATLGDADPQGFLLGQGVAPGAQIGSVNQIGTGGTFSDNERTRQMAVNGAHVMNNSWGQNAGAGLGYIARSQTFDRLVRDPDPATPAVEQLVIVSAAGNDGALGAQSIGAPWEAKNPIVVGNSRNFRPGEGGIDDIRGISDSSSRGPAVDGRILPTVVAPGSDIVAARSTVDLDPATPGAQRPRTAYTDTNAAVHQDYTRLSGTSMAAPHVAGVCALLIQWWRNRTGGLTPSTALLKAFLVNGAEDLVGGPDGAGGTLTNAPNGNQGWGRVSLENMVLQAPASDRGPRIFSDQTHPFTASGDEFTVRVGTASSTRPLRITMAYSDAPGAAGANPALVNNLNLEVEEISTGTIFRGNVLSGGFSVAGGAADNVNNVESVFIQNPAGVYEVRVLGTSVVANAAPPFDMVPWQDFALVIENAEEVATDPVKVAVVLDRSGSMVTYGYVDVTRQASKQFVDLSLPDDRLGVVSFGDSGVVEFPPAPPAELQTIVGPATRAAARAEIDGIAFGGCTFMGEGIQRGGELLAPETGRKGIVLLSDGYDNKGCDEMNPAKPSALDAAAALPDDVPVYSCAMGPTSDQMLLQSLATSTGGTYYFMPTIDDLFEIYNFIRGAVTQDGVVANETAEASSSRVAAFVEAPAERATFTCAWRDTSLKFAPSLRSRDGGIHVHLRDPKGAVVRHDASFVRTHAGDGYVIFDVPDPAPGLWHVEVETSLEQHTRYTVGGFVRSPIDVRLAVRPTRLSPGSPLVVGLDLRRTKLATRVAATATVTAPTMGFPTIWEKFKDHLDRVEPMQFDKGDGPPDDIARLMAVHPVLLKEGVDVFARRAQRVALSAFKGRGGMSGRFAGTAEAGSYNVRVKVSGVAGRSKFVRQDMVSVYVA